MGASGSDAGYFDVARSAEVVSARMSAEAGPQLREVMASLVRHLHAFVRTWTCAATSGCAGSNS